MSGEGGNKYIDIVDGTKATASIIIAYNIVNACSLPYDQYRKIVFTYTCVNYLISIE